jgi:transcriptional regulator GlxA family with amidase domain
MATTGPHRVGMLAFEGVAGLDLMGPAEVFAAANDELAASGAAARYEVCVVAPTLASFTAESGVRMLPHLAAGPDLQFDTIIVPGGPGLREPGTNEWAASWLLSQAARTPRVASVCTGVYGLAATGLLDGRRAVTHWKHVRDAARRFPKVCFEADAIFLRDGDFFTSAGVTASIDLTLAFVEADHGAAVALAAARNLVVYLKRAGGQMQYSEPLRMQARAGDRFADLAAWMVGHLDADLSVEALAARTNMSPRHFSRCFRAAFELSPADYVEVLRLDAARRSLAETALPVASVAFAAGFRSDDAFRRAFERRFGVTPTAWRARFGSHLDAGEPVADSLIDQRISRGRDGNTVIVRPDRAASFRRSFHSAA